MRGAGAPCARWRNGHMSWLRCLLRDQSPAPPLSHRGLERGQKIGQPDVSLGPRAPGRRYNRSSFCSSESTWNGIQCAEYRGREADGSEVYPNADANGNCSDGSRTARGGMAVGLNSSSSAACAVPRYRVAPFGNAAGARRACKDMLPKDHSRRKVPACLRNCFAPCDVPLAPGGQDRVMTWRVQGLHVQPLKPRRPR